MLNNFIIKESSKIEWIDFSKNIEKFNLIQSWEYGDAKAESSLWKPKRFIICNRRNNQVLAIAQLMVIELPIFGGIAYLNRGPLLLNSNFSNYNEKQYIDIIKKIILEAQNRNWRVFQIAPEIIEDEENINKILKLGFKRQINSSWHSGYLNLSFSEDELLMKLDGKWRNLYRKGIKLGVKIIKIKNPSNYINTLINNYLELQKRNKFKGISSKLIKSLSNKKNKNWSFNYFIAKFENEDIGNLVTITHGDTSTYLIGTTTLKGRQMQANSVLLWNAIIDAKNKKSSWFDIGGIDESNNIGVSKFKKGLNSSLYKLSGFFRIFLFFKKKFN